MFFIFIYLYYLLYFIFVIFGQKNYEVVLRIKTRLRQETGVTPGVMTLLSDGGRFPQGRGHGSLAGHGWRK